MGRKRGIATDALGLLLAVIVCAASTSENKAGIQVLDHIKQQHPTITKAWVDQGFKNQFIEHGAALGINVEVVPRNSNVKGFHVIKRRWVAERTLGWLMLHRRLVRDYETLPASSEAMIHIAMIDNVSKRIVGSGTGAVSFAGGRVLTDIDLEDGGVVVGEDGFGMNWPRGPGGGRGCGGCGGGVVVSLSW